MIKLQDELFPTLVLNLKVNLSYIPRNNKEMALSDPSASFSILAIPSAPYPNSRHAYQPVPQVWQRLPGFTFLFTCKQSWYWISHSSWAWDCDSPRATRSVSSLFHPKPLPPWPDPEPLLPLPLLPQDFTYTSRHCSYCSSQASQQASPQSPRLYDGQLPNCWLLYSLKGLDPHWLFWSLHDTSGRAMPPTGLPGPKPYCCDEGCVQMLVGAGGQVDAGAVVEVVVLVDVQGTTEVVVLQGLPP